MKLETAGNVIGFPDVAAKGGHGFEHQPDAETAADEQRQAGFFSMLRKNLESAEQIVSVLEPGEERPSKEEETFHREGLLDISYFGTLLGAIATKMAATPLRETPRNWQTTVSGLALKPTDMAREFAVHGRSEGEDGKIPPGVNALSQQFESAELSAFSVSRANHPAPNSVRVLEMSVPETAMIDAEESTPNWLVVQGNIRSIATRFSGNEPFPQQTRDAAESEKGDPAQVVFHVRGPARTEVAADSKSFQRDSSDSSSNDALLQTAPEVMQVFDSALPGRTIDKPPSQQIADNINSAIFSIDHSRPLNSGEKIGTIKFKLHPENLGEIEVHIKIIGDKVEVGIVMERGEATRAVRQARDDLRVGLVEHGLSLEMFDVSVVRPVRETPVGGPSDMLQQGNQQSGWNDTSANASGDTFYSRSGNQSGSGNGGEDENDTIQHVVEESSPRRQRSGVFL